MNRLSIKTLEEVIHAYPEEVIYAYKVVTGICVAMTKEFVDSITDPEIITTKGTKNSYEADLFRKFLELLHNMIYVEERCARCGKCYGMHRYPEGNCPISNGAIRYTAWHATNWHATDKFEPKGVNTKKRRRHAKL